MIGFSSSSQTLNIELCRSSSLNTLPFFWDSLLRWSQPLLCLIYHLSPIGWQLPGLSNSTFKIVSNLFSPPLAPSPSSLDYCINNLVFLPAFTLPSLSSISHPAARATFVKHRQKEIIPLFLCLNTMGVSDLRVKTSLHEISPLLLTALVPAQLALETLVCHIFLTQAMRKDLKALTLTMSSACKALSPKCIHTYLLLPFL